MHRFVLRILSVVLVTAACTVSAKTEDSTARPYGIPEYVPFTTSRVVGSPDPPLPFEVQRALPELVIEFPIFVTTELLTQRILFIDNDRTTKTFRLCRLKSGAVTATAVASGGGMSGGAAGEGETPFEVLLETPDSIYSVCFHPKYSKNGFLYVGGHGMREGDRKTCRITRYTLSRAEPFQIEPDSATVIIEWESNGHNGAAPTFGLDGMLYVTTGDGTSDSDTNIVGQGLDHLLAKVLRLDVDHPDEGRAYSIPADNPFVGVPNARGETWAYGLRNPWRMTTDPQTGHIWVGNNGQDLWEQVYFVRRGDNYGWSVYEGGHPFYLERQLGPTPHVKPTFDHPHAEARSLTGGVVYYGRKLPELRGAYIYGDYSTGKIWAGKHDGQRVTWHQEIADGRLQITSFGIGPDGELLITDHQKEGGFYTLEAVTDRSANTDFPRKLSDSGLFRNVAKHEMQAGVIPYSVNSPLWSDGAIKSRFFAIPAEAGENAQPPKIGVNGVRSWDFPEGSVLVKSFGLEMAEGDPASQRWIETRFLVRQYGEWVGYSYEWNQEQTDAVLIESAGADRIFEVRSADGTSIKRQWRYPSRAECMVCHSRAANFVLGLSTPQMNRDHDYGAVVDNQLRTLEHVGFFKLKRKPGMEDSFNADDHERLADPYSPMASLEDRARSYLHANCAHCHVAAGGGNAQMLLSIATKTPDMRVIDEPPLHHRFGIDDARLVVPGSPERSVLLKRLSTRERGGMPQIGTAIPDDQAVALFRDWIAQLKATPAKR
jgi:uncharacterized repeat protein (TIGR03806 family)